MRRLGVVGFPLELRGDVDLVGGDRLFSSLEGLGIRLGLCGDDG
jgi:hypothetical protein